MEASKLVYTLNEAEVRTGIDRDGLRLLIGWGKLPVLQAGRRMVIRRDVMEAFLEANRGRNLMKRDEVLAVRYGEL